MGNAPVTCHLWTIASWWIMPWEGKGDGSMISSTGHTSIDARDKLVFCDDGHGWKEKPILIHSGISCLPSNWDSITWNTIMEGNQWYHSYGKHGIHEVMNHSRLATLSRIID